MTLERLKTDTTLADKRFRIPAPILVFAITLVLTLGATVYVAQTNRLHEQLRFESAARQAAAALNEHVEAAHTLLRATSGLFAAHGSVNRAEFHSFVERLNLRQRYPGIQGVGYSHRVSRAAEDSLRRALAEQGLPRFTIWPADSAASECYTTVYLEPLDKRNAVALGYNMFSDPVRREAMLRAWQEGTAAATGRVTLVQEIDGHKQAGFLIYLPIYRGGHVPASLAERRESLLGFVYSPFRAGNLLSAVFQGAPAELVNVWVFDGTTADSTKLLYTSSANLPPPEAGVPHLRLPLEVAGRPWLLVFAPRSDADLGAGPELPPLILALGTFVSLILYGVTSAEARARRHAEQAALDLRRSEEAVRASEQRFRFLADFIPTLVWAARPDGTLDYINQRTGDYLGVSYDELLASGWWKYVHPDDLPDVATRWGVAVRSGNPYEAEYRLRRADGTWRWHLDRGAALRNESGRIERWFGTCTDVDDTHRAQEALREAQKLESIGVLAGGIAHDFNNLLTGITGNASLALNTLPPAHEARPMLEDTLKASERAASLTAQLLAYAGKGRFYLQSVDLGRLVSELLPLLRATIPRKVAVQLALESDCPAVYGDASQLQQLLMNLVINGAEAVGDAVGTVMVRLRSEELFAEPAATQFPGYHLVPGRYVRLEVEDTGCGMDPATVAQIFDPFFTTKFTGRGLGLAATLGIVRGHKGGIAIRTSPGTGSCFTVVLPVDVPSSNDGTAASSGDARDAATATRARGRSPGGLVLFADDEPSVRRVGLATLEGLGYEVLLADDGRRALELALSTARQLRVAVLDLTMPELSGAEVANQLREVWPSLPIVVTSGYGEQEALVHLAGIAVDGFLPKPFTNKQLEVAVEAAIGR